MLTPENTVLPNDPEIIETFGLSRNPENYHDEILDEKSGNFEYGQFEIYIPVEHLPLVNYKAGYMTIRMPQTLFDNEYSPHSENPKRFEYVAEKQVLYHRIKEMVESGKGEVEVVLELPHHNSIYIGRNIFFRQAFGQYVDYTGQLKN